MKKFETLSIVLLVIGLLIFFSAPILFLWNTNPLNFSKSINTSVFDNYGSFISGVVGTIFSLASVILFYITLKEQRKDILINQKNSELQIEALALQIKEFEHQRTELEETRKVFEEQSKTQTYQRFENTFFQLIHLHSDIVSAMEFSDNQGKPVKGRMCFREMFQDLTNPLKGEDEYNTRLSKPKKVHNIIEIYEKFYIGYTSRLSIYFSSVERLLQYIVNSGIEANDKKTYIDIVVTNIAKYEIILIYYHGLSKFSSTSFVLLLEQSAIFRSLKEDLITYRPLQATTYRPSAFVF